jgi:hypothetical protein
MGVCLGPAAAPSHARLDREEDLTREVDEENENAIS